MSSGHFKLLVVGKDSYEQTLLNGKRLLKEVLLSEEDEDLQRYSCELSHLDRIFIGVNTLFLFKYPLMKFRQDQIQEQVCQTAEQADEDTIHRLVKDELLKQGIVANPPSTIEDLICHEYTTSQLQADQDQVDFYSAYEEAHHYEEQVKAAQLEHTTQQLKAEKEKMEQEYQAMLARLKLEEQMKIEYLKAQQEQLQANLSQKEEDLKTLHLHDTEKVDKIELTKLQEQLAQVHQEIEQQKRDNELKIREQQDQIKRKIEEEEAIAKKRKEQTLMDYNVNAKSVREANEICKMMGKNIKFKQCIIQQVVDQSGRAMTLVGVDDLQRQDSVLKEELQIRVHNYDKNTITMWTEGQFQDRLEMMRDGLNTFED